MTFADLNKKLGGDAIEADWKRHPNGGGWVHKNANVDVSAYVGEDAGVSGDAYVSGDAWVYGHAQVYGDARVSGNAQVSGSAWEKSPLYIQGTRHALTNAKKGYIQIGCKLHTFAWWSDHVEECGKSSGYTDAECAEYRAYVDLFVKVGK